MTSQPITAAAQSVPTVGLRAALGLGVILPAADDRDPGGRWLQGYHLEGEVCSNTYRVGEECDDEAVRPEPGAFEYYGPDSMPFLVGASVKCSMMGSPDDLSQWYAKSDRALELCQWSDIGQELWTGDVARDEGWGNRRLASDDAEVLSTGGAVSPVEGLSLLEDYGSVCSCGSLTVIHVPVKAIPYLASKGQLRPDAAQRVFTYNGNLVVADPGYPGTGPDGSPPPAGQTWAYITGVLTARLGDVQHVQPDLSAASHFATNDRRVRSERFAAISWQCCHGAALLDLR